MSQNRSQSRALAELLRRRARDLGFHAVGVAPAAALHDDARRLDAWLEAGHHAAMSYMARHREVRADPRHRGMVEGARSVVSVGLAHERRAPDEGLAGHLASFARGPDYHDELRRRLRDLLRSLREHAPNVRGRALVDSAPVLERAWAARAGLGFIGRNTCLIHPTLGSSLLLGELIVDVELEPDEPRVAEGCGACRACVEACPTGALARPEGRDLDARRCLSYWTVESREPLPATLEAHTALFGCDACQDACPWNAGVRVGPTPLRPLDRWTSLTLGDLAEMPLDRLSALIEGTALARRGAERLRERARRLTGARPRA